MIIEFHPQRRDDTLEVVKNGDILTINGVDYDFGPLPDGATLPMGAVDCLWVAGPVHRSDGELIVPLLLPLPANPSPEQAFPDDLFDVQDGPVELPAPLPSVEAESHDDGLEDD